MKLIIDIPERMYLSAKEDALCGAILLVDAIKNGIPLPKAHGRIADIDKVLEEMKATRTYDIPFALEKVKPIIEADTEIQDADSN